MSPGNSNSRGVLTLFNPSFFSSILYKHGDPDGRTTWLAGVYNDVNELFVSVYAPNNGKNDLFYLSLFKEILKTCEKYNIANIYLLGDLNMDLTKQSTGRSNKKITNTILKELKKLDLALNKDKYTFTWNHGLSYSTIDYVFMSKHLNKLVLSYETIWGIDRSDHAAVEVIINLDILKGKGMYRPDTAFLDVPEYIDKFRNELFDLRDQIPFDWDPHVKLEYIKVCIRTLLGTYSKDFTNTLNRNLELTKIELTKLISLRAMLASPGNSASNSPSYDISQLNLDIDVVSTKLDKLLVEKSKYLATRARVNWLEKGERSNKYFLNILHRNKHNSMLSTMFDDNNTLIADTDGILKIVHDYYANLYDSKPCSDPYNVLNLIDTPTLNDSEAEQLTIPLSTIELSKTLKKCGNTAAGPDGIGYKTIKAIWDIYGSFLVDSWNHGIQSGILAPSHRESVICLLEKKGKDPRIIKNLRPISLSNCDIKIITKTLTHRFNKVLPNIIHPMQAAYIPNRQVHDNLRLINLVKDYIDIDRASDSNPVLISLDACKAFDSVGHGFISEVLRKYNVPDRFINMFQVLYNQIESRVQINGFQTNAFKIKRSVKQGDALSCVLFNLCVDVLLRMLDVNNNIANLRILNLHIPKCVAYADDVAIITNSESVNQVFNTYSKFSLSSGLYLNVDKTEILNLSSRNTTNSFNISCDGTAITLNAVESITICGIAFSNNHELEYNANVKNKVVKLEKALDSWRKRSLSIFGRNLILKTFGLSQILYSMQNTFFSNDTLQKINSICFNFLWNKKPDKTKAYERVSRLKLLKPRFAGGINAPCIDSIDKALKVKQFLRSLSCSHPINSFQKEIIGELHLLNNITSKSKLINRVIDSINQLGKMCVEDILDAGDQKLSRYYYDLLSGVHIESLIINTNNNQIARAYSRKIKKDLGVLNLKQLINEYKFPRSDQHIVLVKFIYDNFKSLLNILSDRKQLDEQSEYLETVPVGVNKFVSSKVVATKMLTYRFTHKSNLFTDIDVRLKYGLHPKENEVHWLMYHNACLSNEKLFRMRMVESDKCPNCLVIQSTDHIFNHCINALIMWNTLNEEFNIEICQSDMLIGLGNKRDNEVLLLAKRMLLLNRNSLLDKKFIRCQVENRLNDFCLIQNRKKTNKDLMRGRKHILSF